MSSIDSATNTESSQTVSGSDSASDNKVVEQVITVFELSSEIEQSLKHVLEEIDKNETQFQKSLKSIHTQLRALER
ncbi:HDL510Wp [Eremothecium sinecaudum]|uniref:HDL510Wp n=1 Tax=Eremothecium sinecaudum TaxID=45286 RepID=A0A0X8HRP0_9SACH|nr:HDL510Wp [Eremothecium sinecaudum]AMD20234.1 HDL510Wp [Eremothecium sinecaudum]